LSNIVYHKYQINHWLSFSKLFVFLGLIFFSTLWWGGLDLEWLHDFFDLLLYVVILVFLAWHYKIKAKWVYCNSDIIVLFYFNLFGYQKVVIKTNGSTMKEEFLSYKPQSCSFNGSFSLEFSRLNQELGGFGLHLNKNGKVLIPDNIEQS
jgi:hypothetical protein